MLYCNTAFCSGKFRNTKNRFMLMLFFYFHFAGILLVLVALSVFDVVVLGGLLADCFSTFSFDHKDFPNCSS